MITRLFDIVFYQYDKFAYNNNEKDDSHYSSLFIISCLQSLNVYLIANLIYLFDIITISVLKTLYIVIYIFITIVNYFYFVRSKRYRKIRQLKTIMEKSKKNNVITTFYTILSIIVFVLSLFMKFSAFS